MSTPKEIFLETIKPNGQPERLLRVMSCSSFSASDETN